MTLSEVKEFELTLSEKEIYSTGWNGEEFTIEKYAKKLLKKFNLDGDISIKYVKYSKYRFKVTQTTNTIEKKVKKASKLETKACPTCHGYGTYEVWTSHSFDVECERCKGTGVVPIDDKD